MDDLMGLEAAVEQLNSGAPIATIDPYLVERMWEALSRIPRAETQHPAGGYVGALFDPDLVPSNPEQKLSMMVRYALLNALIERGVLDEYMKDEASRKTVFAAAALLPCDGNDLQEALMGKILRQSPPDVRPKREEELKHAGYDADHLKVAAKFIAWMRNNC